MKLDLHSSILIQELLRVGLIASRNIASCYRLNKIKRKMLVDWLNLCHSLPSVLIGESRAETILFFLDGDADLFIHGYPCKEDADYIQAVSLLSELREESTQQGRSTTLDI